MAMHSESIRTYEYMMCLIGIELLLFMVFTVLHLFWFYVFFEAILVPFFILIGLQGSRERKVHASYMLLFYTVCGSLLMLIGIIIIYVHTGSTHYFIIGSVEYA
jgi:NADH:ubiquinone oxidoreductase subunit 4 (subunit M)